MITLEGVQKNGIETMRVSFSFDLTVTNNKCFNSEMLNKITLEKLKNSEGKFNAFIL